MTLSTSVKFGFSPDSTQYESVNRELLRHAINKIKAKKDTHHSERTPNNQPDPNDRFALSLMENEPPLKPIALRHSPPHEYPLSQAAQLIELINGFCRRYKITLSQDEILRALGIFCSGENGQRVPVQRLTTPGSKTTITTSSIANPVLAVLENPALFWLHSGKSRHSPTSSSNPTVNQAKYEALCKARGLEPKVF